MTREDLKDKVREDLGLTKQEASEIVEGVIDTIRESLTNGEEIILSGFGRFLVRLVFYSNFGILTAICVLALTSQIKSIFWFGILLAFGMLFPNTELMLLFPPIPIKAKWFVLGYGVLELYSGFANNPTDNVAHFAHLGGMLFGFFLIQYWKKDRGSFY